jgi:hypothetical protein
MTEWISQMVSEARERRNSEEDDQRKRERALQAYECQVDEFWVSFLDELRQQIEEFNAQVTETERIAINTPEPAMLALRKDRHPGGQFVARLRRHETRAEMNILVARSINNIDCPIVVDEKLNDLRLAFRASNGQLHDQKSAVETLLSPYLRYTLGLISDEVAEGPRKIGF